MNTLKTNEKNILPLFSTAPHLNAMAGNTQNPYQTNTLTPGKAYLDTASSHVLLHSQQQYITTTPHHKLAVKFANGTHANSIGSGTISPGPVTIPVSILKKSDLVTQLLGVAPFTQAGCETHLTNTSATITKKRNSRPFLSQSSL